ncbi:MAG: hypothetical protein D3919_00700 [Candidatus Electrothrix sp. AW5]|nr:hypothetical protein [Candidatus Electrothrix gigas]
MHHAIRQQRIEISAAHPEQARRIQMLVSEIFHTDILRLMDQTLSAYSSDQTVLRIDKLDVDVGRLESDDFAEQFLRKLPHALTEALDKLTVQSDSPQPLSVDEKNTIASLSAELSEPDQLSFFLETGQVSWTRADSTSFDPEQSLLTLLRERPHEATRLLSGLSSSAVERLVKQLSPSARKTTLEALLTPLHHQAIEQHETFWHTLKKYLADPSCLPSQAKRQQRLFTAFLHDTDLPFSAQQFADILHTLDIELLRSVNADRLIEVSRAVQEQLPETSRVRQWLESRLAFWPEQEGMDAQHYPSSAKQDQKRGSETENSSLFGIQQETPDPLISDTVGADSGIRPDSAAADGQTRRSPSTASNRKRESYSLGTLLQQVSPSAQLHFFLETGQIPPGTTEQLPFNPELSLLHLLQEEPESAVRLLTDLTPNAVQRLVQQFSATAHQAVLAVLLSPQQQRTMQEQEFFWNTLEKHAPDSIALPSQTVKQRTILTALLAEPNLLGSTQYFVDVLHDLDLQFLNTLTPEQVVTLTEVIHARFPAESMHRQQYESLLASYKQRETAKESRQGTRDRGNEAESKTPDGQPPSEFDSDDAKFSEPSQNRGVPLHNRQDTPTDSPKFPIRKPDYTAISEEPCYINNAGLILIWPFLSRYFRSLNLMKDNAFISEEHQERAVLLSSYVQTGESKVYEHNLLLNKLLCGWPRQKPLLSRITISKQEERETTELLESLIQHWKILKNTSISGLRQSFLQREGRLLEKEQGWELLVNRTGYDVLLDQLPWGIGTIYLPWMKKTLFVEW